MNIKELRLSTRMTQKEFGECLGIPRRTIQNWELGDRTPPEYVLELIKYKIEKERLGMKKELNIFKNKEDGDLTLSHAGIDLKDYDYITVEEFIDIVEESEFWNDIDPEIYKKALEDVGLNYSDYSDPDKMWEDFLKIAGK